MSKKITNSVLSTGYTVKVPAPIDDRTQFSTIKELLDYTLNQGLGALYDGLEVFVDETGFSYRWVESQIGLMNIYNGYDPTDSVGKYYTESYTYDASVPDYSGVTYAGRSFNWVNTSAVPVFNLVVEDKIMTDEEMLANTLGIHFRAHLIPYENRKNKIVQAIIKVDGESAIEYPGEIVWDGEDVTLKCYPMYATGTSITVKLL